MKLEVDKANICKEAERQSNESVTNNQLSSLLYNWNLTSEELPETLDPVIEDKEIF